MSQIRVVGWFCYKDENQYNEFLSVFTDAGKVPFPFGKWKQLTEKGIQETERSGVIVIRAYAESAEEFTAWCRVHQCGIDAKGRTGFANAKARAATK
ncbi:cytochrome c family protein [Yersinia pseudotuberculosis]|uniref:hypothetical protein n=1 Tax=Yersinia pseudotuberculosis TaxID=633 RepID=UPI0005AD323B|nr:hypothetical protein [Yersinia pseudotuberculosis]AJJ71520.1 hypothetical protein BZ23_680 [Yersinia pseudotuberculosis]CNK15552.1 Uncharacterised protein [Yersinia pseudotuberculosis]